MSKSMSFFKDVVIFAFGSLGSKMLAFLLLPLYTHTLSQTDFGFIEMINVTLIIAVPIIGLQSAEAVFRYLLDAKGEGEKSNIITASLVILFLTTILFFIIYSAGRTIIDVSELLKQMDTLTFVLVLSTLLVGLLKQITRGLGRNVIFALSDILLTLSLSVSTYYFLVIKSTGIIGFFISNIIANFLVILYLIIGCKLWKYIKINNKVFQYIPKMIIYGLPLIPNVLAGWFLTTSDRYLIAKFSGLVDVGLYSVASKYVNILTIFSSIIILAWQSNSVSYFKEKNASDLFSRTFEIYFFFMSLIFVLLNIMMKPFLALMVTESYNTSQLYIPTLLGSSFFLAMSSFFAAIYLIVKRTKNLFYSSITIGLLSLILNYFLIPKFGGFAATISSLIAASVLLWSRILDTRKYIRVNINIKFIFPNFLIMLFISLISYLELSLKIYWLLNISALCTFFLFNIKIIMSFWINAISKLKSKNLMNSQKNN